MDQRRLRLGDILDDYCPRERRVTNHAVVAMIEDEVRQTRCTTCDAEHVYKGARVPKRRKKETPGALYKEVLAGMPEESTPALAVTVPADIIDVPETPDLPIAVAPAANDEAASNGNAGDEHDLPADAVEEGPVHRQLLRAKLPRPEGQKDARPLPEFTIRQAATRGNGHFRGDRSRMRGGSGDQRSTLGRGGGPVNGNRAQGGGRGPGYQGGGRPGQQRPGGRGGSSNPFRGGPPRQGGHGGKKGRG